MSPHSSPERVFSGRIKDRNRETAEIEPSCSLPYIDIISRDRKKWFQTTCDTIYANHFSISFETAPDAPFSYKSGVTVTQFPDLSLLLLLVFEVPNFLFLFFIHSGVKWTRNINNEALSLFLIQWPQCQACRVQSCCQYVFFFSQYLSRGIQFSRASINGALKKTVKFCVTLQNLHFDHIWV